ncbi:hypothetical protein Q2T76_04175 [Lactobacillus sp. YT155]|uniref:hypothetical protein n=1 Tax=Lactobacillus sp. YT155 TaxID=3060955 RepID=UPI00265EE18E|nr:hypothetical protein [Lactobacillus sp. YT155]MDO1605251.1 hypothetical protein [Lactobacillus sp. YT155]
MKTKIVNSSKMNLEQKKNWIKSNYHPFSWPESEYVGELFKKNLNFEYLVSFSNGNSLGRGSVLWGIKQIDDMYILDRISILADDVFGGGPTQKVIYDFFESDLEIIRQNINCRYLYFTLENIDLFERSEKEILSNLKKYRIKAYQRIQKSDVSPYYKIKLNEKLTIFNLFSK